MSKQFTYTLQMDAEIGDLVAKVEKAKASMKGLAETGKFPAIDKSFMSMQKALERLQLTAKTPITSVATFGNMQKDIAGIEVQLQNLEKILEQVGSLSNADKIELLPPDMANTIKSINGALSTFSTSLEEAKKKTTELVTAEKELAKAKKELAASQGKQAEAQQKLSDEQERIRVRQEDIKTIKEQIKVLKEYQATQKLYDEAGAQKNKKFTDDAGVTHSLPKAKNDAKKVTAELGVEFNDGNMDEALSILTEKLNEQEKALKKSEAAEGRFQESVNSATSVVTAKQAAVDKLNTSFEELNSEFEKNKAKNVNQAFQTLRKKAQALGVSLEGIPLEYTEEGFTELQNRMQSVANSGFEALNKGAQEASLNMQEVAESAKKAANGVSQSTDTFQEGMEKFKDNSAILERVKAFVGLEGGIEIARSAMRNAINTIKELDAVMAEMAVVTDLEVGDYWEQLPQHTKAANELGVAITEVYEAETLYLQQGLKMNDAQTMANTTLKMARIAGLSAAEATDKMTAALRGFNMELNETSAQKVADVYSKLAAITAADVDEISTAMSKTASIASAAGMDFETTAAFLSQIIETTRESAETAGTAMKTVIARFSEVKNLQNEGIDTGTDEEGEVIDVNKIQTALRSVGISMDEFFNGTEGLDDIFLQLAEKWDTLDVKTQRYIATTAAGSRQQSRFIAMMSDYSRTQELVSAANNSVGASNEQFGKTLETLESKLAKLKNAWDSFTMSIMNNELVKAAVDLLTLILTKVNEISAAFDKFGLGGVASIGMVVAALYLGDKALKVFMTTLRGGGTIFQSFGAVARAAIDSITGRITKTTKTLSNMKKVLIENQKNMKMFGKVKVHVDSKPATQAMNDFTKATNNQIAAQKLRESVAKNNAISEETRMARMAALDKIEAQNEQRKTEAAMAYFATQGLTSAQEKEAIALTSMGIGVEAAAAAAKGGLTAAKMADYQATMLASGMDKEEIALRTAQILGLYTEAGAEGTATAAKTTGIAALWGKITAGAANIASLVAQTVAQWAFNIAEWAGCPPTIAFALVILILVAALVAVVAIIGLAIAGIIAFVKAVQANSPEGKLKSAQEAAEAAGEAAESANEAFKNLADGLGSLDDKYKSLENLTKGTQEWKDAVRDINTEVMDLIEQYPELAKFVENKDGVMTLDMDSEGVQKVMADYENKVSQATAAELAAKMEVNNRQTAVDKKNLSDAATVQNEAALGWQKFGGVVLGAIATGIGASFGGTIGASLLGGAVTAAVVDNANKKEQEGEEATDKMAKALADGLLYKAADGTVKAVEGSEEQLEELGLTIEEVEKFGKAVGEGADELKEYGEALRQREAEEKAYYNQMASNAVNAIDMTEKSEEERTQIANAATDEYMKTFTDESLKDIQEKYNSLDKNEKKEWTAEQAKQLYGTDEIEVDDNGNVIIGTGDEKKTVTKENFEKQLAAAKGQEAATKALKRVPQALDKLATKTGPQVGKAIENVFMGSEGNALTQQNLADLKQFVNDPNKLRESFFKLSKKDQEAFGSFENFEKQVKESMKISEQAFADASETLGSMGVSIEFSGDMTAEAVKGYASQLETIAITSGSAGAEMVDASLDSLTKNLSPEQLQIFMRELNALDWSNAEDWESFPDTLNALGIALPTSALESFITTASEASNAVRKIDFTKITDNMGTLMSYVKEMKSGFGSRTMSSEAYDALIEINPKLASAFGEDLEGNMVYLGGTIKDLTGAIEDNTVAYAEDRKTELDTAVGAGEIMADLQNRYTWGDIELDITQWEDWEEDSSGSSSAIGYLEQFMKKAKEQGLDLSKLGISGLSNTTDLAKLEKSPEKLAEVMNKLTGVFTSLGDNTEKLNELVRTLSQAYQTEHIVSNLDATENYRDKLASGQKLTEGEQTAYKARQQTIQIQAQVAGVNQVDYENYTKTLAYLQQLEQGYQEGRYSTEEFLKYYKEARAEVEKFEKVVVNKTSYKSMQNALGETLTLWGEFYEKYKNLGEHDIEGRMEAISQAVSRFGIQVTEQNQEVLGQLLETAVGGGEAGMQAIANILDFSAAKYGLSQKQFLEIEKTNWDRASESQQQYADAMVAAGMAQWKVIDGVTKFVWNSQEAIQASLEETGVKIDKWVNSYDAIFNLNSELNSVLRQREKLEKSYERLLENENATTQEITDNIAKRMMFLAQEAYGQQEKATQALGKISYLAEQNSQYDSLYKFDATTGTLVVDSSAIEKLGWSTEEGEVFEEFISGIEEQVSIYQESQDTIEDIQDEVEEIRDTGRDSMSKIYDWVKNGLVAKYEEQIDGLSSIFEAVNEAREQFVDKLQTIISETREIRDNMEEEEEIQDLETKLAFLQRDTSGANQRDILSLQKQIEEKKQSYTDSLTDDAIQELQNSNAEASKQREEQINIMKQQLDAYLQSPQIWSDVQQIIDQGLQAVVSGQKFQDTEAGYLATLSDDLTSKNPIEAEEYYEQLERSAKEGAVYSGFTTISDEVVDLSGDNKANLEDLGEVVSGAVNTVATNVSTAATNLGTIGNVTLPNKLSSMNTAIVTALGSLYSGTAAMASTLATKLGSISSTVSGVKTALNKIPSSMPSNDSIASALTSGLSSMYSGLGTIAEAIKGLGRDAGGGANAGTSATHNYSTYNYSSSSNSSYNYSGSSSGPSPSSSSSSSQPKVDLGSEPVKNNSGGLTKTTKDEALPAGMITKETKIKTPLFEDRVYVGDVAYVPYNDKYYVKLSDVAERGGYENGYYAALKGAHLYAIYEKGGLADFTGPAWLDGTKSHPEMVLNARDTENFIQLKDILADILTNSSVGTSQTSSNVFDIDINVDSISEDYDVEQLAEKIKEIIYNESMYRNVNTINLTR